MWRRCVLLHLDLFLLRYSNTRLKQRMRFCCNAVMYFRRFFRDVERDEYNSCRGNLIINVNASTVQRVTAGMACQPTIQAKPTYSSDLIYTPDTSKAAVVSGESWSPSSPAHTMNYWTVRRPALSTHICHTSAVWSVFRPEKNTRSDRAWLDRQDLFTAHELN